MAAEWIKFEKSTLDKPEVLAIAAAINQDPDFVVGKLLRMWAWFDTHTVSGNASCVTAALLDSILRVTGFVSEVAKVGWLVVDSDGISLPNFDRHNGETAKQRALTSKRVAGFKAANANGNDKVTQGALPREEKKREEKKEQKTAPSAEWFDGIPGQVVADFRALRTKLRAPITATAMDGIKREAAKAGVSLADAMRMCCERGWRGFKAEWVRDRGSVVQITAGTPRRRQELGA